MCLTDDPAPSYLALPELPPIQQVLHGRAVNTKFRGDLVDGKMLFNRSRGLGLFLHLVTVSRSARPLMNRSCSRLAFSK